MAVRAPFDVDEALHALALCQQTLLILAIVSAIPAGPYRGRIHIGDVAREVAAAKRGQARTVEAVRQIAHLSHEATDRLLVNARILVRPVVLIAQPPQDDRRVVV